MSFLCLSECKLTENVCVSRYGSLTAEQREAIGVQCKQLIDFGRVQYLKQHGFDASLIYYVARSVTLENMALTAVRCKTGTVE